MNTIPTTQTKTNWKKRRILICVLPLITLLLIVYGKGCLCTAVSMTIGYAETGYPNSKEEIPTCLGYVSLFTIKWPISYHYFTNIHNRTGYTVCGYSTLEQVRSACKELGLDLHEWNERSGDYDFYLEDINKRFQEWSKDIPIGEREARKVYEKGECTSKCFIFSGKDPDGGIIEIGYYRPEDGYFAILGRKTAYCWSEVKGVRTVYVPGIGEMNN